jgi:hypothetical protein
MDLKEDNTRVCTGYRFHRIGLIGFVITISFDLLSGGINRNGRIPLRGDRDFPELRLLLCVKPY